MTTNSIAHLVNLQGMAKWHYRVVDYIDDSKVAVLCILPTSSKSRKNVDKATGYAVGC